MKILSPKYPELKIHDLNIHFKNGEACVEDEGKIKILKGLPELGLVFEQETKTKSK